MNDNDIHPIMKELTKVTKEMPMPVVTEIKIITNRDAYKILISTMLSRLHFRQYNGHRCASVSGWIFVRVFAPQAGQ